MKISNHCVFDNIRTNAAKVLFEIENLHPSIAKIPEIARKWHIERKKYENLLLDEYAVIAAVQLNS